MTLSPQPNTTNRFAPQSLFATAITNDFFRTNTYLFAGDIAQVSPIEMGQIVGQRTADGVVMAYDPAATDGTEVAMGILGTTIHDGALYRVDGAGVVNPNDVGITVYTAGIFRHSALNGIDAAAESALGAVVDTTADTIQFGF